MTATITLSLEIELGWGALRKPSSNTLEKISDRRRKETETIGTLLDWCDKAGVAFSFDTVGHLLLDSCDGDHDCPFADHFNTDPSTDVRRDPLFYAPDIITDIRDRPVNHEICTHTFSHINCAETPDAIVDWELKQVRKIHAREGIDYPKSIVPPWHAEIPHQALHDNDISVLRTPLSEYTRPQTKLQTYPWMLRKSHPITGISTTDGITKTYCTPHPSLTAPYLPTGRLPPSPVFRAIPVRIRQQVHERYLIQAVEKAIQNDSHIHLWSHLYNMAHESQWPSIRSLITTLGQYNNKGLIEIKRMQDLASQ